MKKFDPIFRNIKKIKNFKVNSFPDLKTEKMGVSPLSNSITKTVCKRDPLSYRWKRGQEETKSTVEEIERKSKQIGILYNKGSYQYIDTKEIAKNLGRK